MTALFNAKDFAATVLSLRHAILQTCLPSRFCLPYSHRGHTQCHSARGVVALACSKQARSHATYNVSISRRCMYAETVLLARSEWYALETPIESRHSHIVGLACSKQARMRARKNIWISSTCMYAEIPLLASRQQTNYFLRH